MSATAGARPVLNHNQLPARMPTLRAVYNLANGTTGALIGPPADVDALVADLRSNGHTGTVRITRLNRNGSAEYSPRTITLTDTDDSVTA